MTPVILAAFTLLGTIANGLDCRFGERCIGGICTAVEPAPLRVLFVSSPATPEPATFVLGDARLFEGTPVTAAEVPAISRMFGGFSGAPEGYSYAVADFLGYDPTTGGTVQIEVNGRIMTVAADGATSFITRREGRPEMSWLVSHAGQCSARTYQ